jgi:Family of unknown function (DUF5684)
VPIAVYTILANSGAAVGILVATAVVALVILELAGLWKVYAKAGEHGWAAIVPFYNYWCLLRIVGRPGWWLILYFVPLVNIVIALIVLWDLTKSFAKPAGWFWGLLLLGFVFYPMLGFGESRYAGPAGPDTRATAR